jgi:hypothetical protein
LVFVNYLILLIRVCVRARPAGMQALFFMFQQIGEMPMSDKVVNEQTFKEGLEATNER